MLAVPNNFYTRVRDLRATTAILCTIYFPGYRLHQGISLMNHCTIYNLLNSVNQFLPLISKAARNFSKTNQLIRWKDMGYRIKRAELFDVVVL